MVAVLDHLGIAKIDLYGDSYGTFFSQTFAVHYPKRLRTLILDAAYFVGGTDPWYTDTNRALRTAFRLACRRSPTCAAPGARSIGSHGWPACFATTRSWAAPPTPTAWCAESSSTPTCSSTWSPGPQPARPSTANSMPPLGQSCDRTRTPVRCCGWPARSRTSVAAVRCVGGPRGSTRRSAATTIHSPTTCGPGHPDGRLSSKGRSTGWSGIAPTSSPPSRCRSGCTRPTATTTTACTGRHRAAGCTRCREMRSIRTCPPSYWPAT